jgi:glucokinase
MLLAGDIGGTNTRLGLFQVDGGSLRLITSKTYPSRDHASLNEIVREFVAAGPVPVEAATFGVAGPVRDGRSHTSNLPWIVDSAELARELGLEKVGLINDLEANAYGVAMLGSDDLVVLNAGEPDARGNLAIISAGTGLGEAGCYWDGREHHPFASEGGHSDFAPRDELETELLSYLATRFGRVSYERVLSGPGLFNVYQFLRDTGRGEQSDWLAQEIGLGDPSAAISSAALEGRSELCEQAIEIFVSIYGGEAGNLALKLMALGGVYLGGGIAPKVVQKLTGPTFMGAFTAKGRMKSLLESVPVSVITNEKTALLGSARHALGSRRMLKP